MNRQVQQVLKHFFQCHLFCMALRRNRLQRNPRIYSVRNLAFSNFLFMVRLQNIRSGAQTNIMMQVGFDMFATNIFFGNPCWMFSSRGKRETHPVITLLSDMVTRCDTLQANGSKWYQCFQIFQALTSEKHCLFILMWQRTGRRQRAGTI